MVLVCRLEEERLAYQGETVLQQGPLEEGERRRLLAQKRERGRHEESGNGTEDRLDRLVLKESVKQV